MPSEEAESGAGTEDDKAQAGDVIFATQDLETDDRDRVPVSRGERGIVRDVDEDGDFWIEFVGQDKLRPILKKNLFRVLIVPKARAEVVDAVRAAVVEIRELNGREGAEDAMREAKVRLAGAIKAATAAGASQEELVEATTPPAFACASASASAPAPGASGEGEDEAIKIGDQVEIFGLESEGGRQLNGKAGVVVAFVEEKGRYQIELGPGNHVSVRPSNLRRQGAPPGQDDGGHEDEEDEDGKPLTIGDQAEVFGLESESGAKLNGRSGQITEYLEDKGRFKVQFGPEEFVSIKPGNLRRCRRTPGAAQSEEDGRKRSRSASASSSSSSSKPAKKKAKRERKSTNFSGGFSGGADAAPRQPKKKGPLTPEEVLERLLAGKSEKKPKKEKRSSGKDEESAPMDPAERAAQIARDAGAAAAAMAAAMAAAEKDPLKPGDRVEVFGLQSAVGKPLNGKTGLITKWDQAKGRFQVELGLGNLQSLKPENLRKEVSGVFGASAGDGYAGSSAGYTLL